MQESEGQRAEEIRYLVSNHIISKITTDRGLIDFVSGNTCIPYWLRCFRTVLSSASNSLETVETVGDKYLNAFIARKVYADNPYVTPNKLSDSITYYANNYFIAEILDRLPTGTEKRFHEYAEYDQNIIIAETFYKAIRADLFEAIIGTVEITVSLYYNGRFGYEFAYNWFLYAYKTAGFDKLDSEKGSPYTILTQIFTRFESTKYKMTIKYESVDINIPNDPYRRIVKGTRFYLNNETLDVLRLLKARHFIDREIPNVSKIYLVYRDYTPPYNIPKSENPYIIADEQETSRERAADQALKYLMQYFGITPVWATETKRDLEIEAFGFDQIIVQNFKSNIGKIMRKNNVVDFTYEMRQLAGKYNNESANIIQLIGINSENKQEFLLMNYAGGGNNYQNRKELFEQFAKLTI